MRLMVAIMTVAMVAANDSLAEGPRDVDDCFAGSPYRGRLARVGEGRLTRDGAPLSGESKSGINDPLVLVALGDRVQAAWSSETVSLMLWIDAADLELVSVHPMIARSTPTIDPPAHLEGAARIDFASRVEPGAHQGDLVHVRAQTGWVDTWTVTGWVPSTAIARWYRGDLVASPAGSEAPRGFDGPGEVRWLLEDAVVLDQPRGSPIAQPAWDPKQVIVVGEPHKGHVPVRAAGSTRVAGWVLKRSLVRERPTGATLHHMHYASESPVPDANVARGTYLYDSPGGTCVGVARRPLLAERTDPESWGVVKHATPWGTAELAVPPDSLDLRADWPPERDPGPVDEFGLPIAP